MSSHPPEQQSTPPNAQRIALDPMPPIELKGFPSPLQVFMWIGTTALVIISAVAALGAWYLNNRFETTESKLTNVVRESVSPLKDRVTELRLIVGLLVSKNSAFTQEEKDYFSELLKQISYDDLRHFLDELPDQQKRVPLDDLLASKRVEQVRKVTGLVWAENNPAQIRYFKSNDPTLDLKGVDFYTNDSDPCESKNLDLLRANVTAKVCSTHLDSKRRLELIVVQ